MKVLHRLKQSFPETMNTEKSQKTFPRSTTYTNADLKICQYLRLHMKIIS